MMNAHCQLAAILATLLFAHPGLSVAAPSVVEKVSDEVLVVRDDLGNWGGGSLGMTHQRGPGYEARKTLDLSAVPEDAWKAATHVRLSAYFCVHDYSWHDWPPANGLDEAVEIVVNGKVHRIPTGTAGLPVYVQGKSMESSMRWHDFDVPKEQLVRGPNEFVFRMAPPQGKKPDDYLYLGIDNTVPGGRSQVRFSTDAKWEQERVNSVGARGEYMVRLYLIRGSREFAAVWWPGENKPDDPAGAIVYAGSHGPTTRVEWDPARIDRLGPLAVVIETADDKPFEFYWLDAEGKPAASAVKAKGPRHEAALRPPLAMIPSGIELSKQVAVKSVTLWGSKDYHPMPRRVDMCPRIEPPKGAAVQREPSCAIQAGTQDGTQAITLGNESVRCRFENRGGRLRLASLYNEIAAAEMVRRPDDCALLVVEVAAKRYAGSRDFKVRSIAPLPQKQGFTATLDHEETKLTAELSVWIDDALRMDLTVTNRGEKPVDFKLAFPHLAGLAVSEEPADDYYFFPYGGGIISDQPAVIRAGYGDHQTLYQVMDLFSPNRGAGMAVWCGDSDGRHKVLALRKHVPGRAEANGNVAHPPTAPEYLWTNSLDPVPGVGVAYEYLRRTRGPGKSFQAKEAVLWPHTGDWHAALERYAAWCHNVWKFRPWPTRLGPIENMVCAGWGTDVLLRDGQYRTDFLRPGCDCIELMSWWEWSPLGPWRTPIDQIAEKLGRNTYDQWRGYFPIDPVTKRPMFNNGPGDYDGYNQRWGGLPKFREAVESYQKRGSMVTLYTDPLRADDNTKFGQKWGRLWCIEKPEGKPQTAYDAWNPCLEVAEYRRWVAETMGRVIRETGADGIRLDEYGHRGSACYSKLHQHTFAEPGITEWQRCVAESSKLVRQAMDEAKPGSVLTTEHPGYDYLMQFIDGCITYDLTVLSSPLRPLECNSQRFYFPECKAFELDHRGADPKHRKRFWNGVASFGSYYPVPMYRVLRENEDVFSSRDCRPLVPTLAPYVYANSFRAGPKTIYTLYNATGHTFAGETIRLTLAPGEHVFDLLGGREADCEIQGAQATVRLFLPRDDVACLVRLPRVLSAKRTGDVLAVDLAADLQGQQLAVCGGEGQSLASQVVEGRTARLDIGPLVKQGLKPVCIKLLAARRLIDVAAVPGTP
jgi:hypothetical protein